MNGREWSPLAGRVFLFLLPLIPLQLVLHLHQVQKQSIIEHLLQILELKLVLLFLVVDLSKKVSVFVQIETNWLVSVLLNLDSPLQLLVDIELELAFQLLAHALLPKLIVVLSALILGRAHSRIWFDNLVLIHVQHRFVFEFDNFLEREGLLKLFVSLEFPYFRLDPGLIGCQVVHVSVFELIVALLVVDVTQHLLIPLLFASHLKSYFFIQVFLI